MEIDENTEIINCWDKYYARDIASDIIHGRLLVLEDSKGIFLA